MLPSLTDGDVIDVHSYGEEAEALGADPRYRPNFISEIAAAQVYGKPLSITEWNVAYPKLDRFTAPLYVASIASLQGWDAPMIYNYSQTPLQRPGPGEWHDEWSTFCDPAISGVMPAAAIAFRQEHISPARTTYCLKLSPKQLFETNLDPTNTATIRTLAEQSRITIGMPAVKELPWLKPSEPAGRREGRHRPRSRLHPRRPVVRQIRHGRADPELERGHPDDRYAQDPGRQRLDRRQELSAQGRDLRVHHQEGRRGTHQH